MRRFLPVLMGFVVLLLSSTEGWSLSPCPGSPTSRWSTTSDWTDCFGTITSTTGMKYVGEWKNGTYHGQGTYTLANGNKYVGEYKDGKRDGQGTYTLANGNKYVGEYKDGKRDGQGTLTYYEGSNYVGGWKDGSRHGQGTFFYTDGDKYVGEHKDDKKHGQGTYTFANGRIEEGIWENGWFKYAKKPSPTVTAEKSQTKGSSLPPCPGSPVSNEDSAKSWTDCFGTFTAHNGKWKGDKYVGEWKDGSFHGHGTYNFSGNHEFKGDKYVGEFRKGIKDVQGTYTSAGGDKYVGEMKDGNPNGRGTYTFASGDNYVGEFKDGKKHGQGIYYYLADNQFKGDKYVGEMKNGKSHGQGTFTSANGDKYVGEHKDGKFHGQGTLIVGNLGSQGKHAGEKYVGEYRDGKKNGQGTYTYTNGDKYVGEYRNSKKNGQGTYTYANGHKYVGEYRDSKMHGQGTFTFASGHKYVGEYRDGKRNGQGTFTHASGSKYIGEYRDGKRNGQGTFTHASGHKYIGEWKDSKYSGQGTFTHASGSKYIGEWKDSKYSGQGTFTFANGRVKEGIWENNNFLYAKKIPKASPKKKPPVVAKVAPKKTKPKPQAQSISASGFFVSKLGHVITNEHVVRNCKSVTVGDDANKQSPANVEETDRRNDLALLKLSTLTMASAETKSLIAKLGIRVVPLASDGLLRPKDVELGEKIMVSGYPYGDIFSNTIKVTAGIVSAVRGMGDDSSQFTMDAAVQKGSSGGPIYDENGNVVGVVVAKLDRAKVAKQIGSMPENMNFGIKASTVRQFLTSSGLPTKWSSRSTSMSTKELAKIAQKQTLMVMCSR